MPIKNYTNRFDLLKSIGILICTSPNFEGENKPYGIGLYKNLKLKNFSCLVMPNIAVKFYMGTKCVLKISGEYDDTARCNSDFPPVTDPGIDFKLINNVNSRVIIDNIIVQVDKPSRISESDFLIKSTGIIMFPTPNYTGYRKNYSFDPPQMISSPREVKSFKLNPPFPNLAKFSFVLLPNTSVEFASGQDSGAIPVLNYTSDNNDFLFVKDAESGKPVTNMTLKIIEPVSNQYIIEGFNNGYQYCNSGISFKSFINIGLLVALLYVIYLIYWEMTK